MGTLFEYAVLFHPKKKDGDSQLAEILIPPVLVVARSETEVTIRASRAIPDSHLDKLDQVEVRVRPF